MNKQVVLVKINKPEFMYIPPLGLLYVGDSLKKAGYDVKIFHLKTTEINHYSKKILEMKPIFVGFSVFTGEEIRSYVKMSQIIKACSNIPVVWGNAHPSMLPEQILKEKFVDFVVIGEGEMTAVELANSINGTQNYKEIKGVAFRQNNDEIVINPRREFIVNLDDYSLGWDLVNIKNYIKPYWELERVLQFVTSRGCPHNCGFCYNLVFNSRKWRAHSAEKVISEINHLKQKYNLQGIIYWDDNFFVDKRRAFKIVSEINLPYYADARLDYIDEQFSEQLAKTKCRYLLTGAESGSDRILKLIGKGATVAATYTSTKNLKKYPSVRMSPSIIFAFPTETRAEYLQTIRMIINMFEINNNLVFTTGFFLPYPGTNLYELCKKNGFIPPEKTEDWADMDRWTNKIEIAWINWGSVHEFMKMRNRIQVLGILYRYNVPILKKILKWRILNEFYFFEFEVSLISFLRDKLFRSHGWTSNLAKKILRKYWIINRTFSRK